MSAEQRGPADCSSSDNMGRQGWMITPPVSLQDPRKSLYIKAKTELGWKRWNKQWLYSVLGLFNGYRVRYLESL